MSVLSKIRQVINPKVVYLVVCHRCNNNNNNNNNNNKKKNNLYAMSQNSFHYIYQFTVFRSILRYSMI